MTACWWSDLGYNGESMRAPCGKSIVRRGTVFLLVWISVLGVTWGGTEEKWAQAEEAYARSEFENGHAALKQLMEESPGDDALAARALERMLIHVRRQRWHHRLLPRENPWGFWAAERYCSLERRKVVSAHSETMRLAVDLVVDGAIKMGQAVRAHELIARLRKENPQNLYWQFSEAEMLRKLDASGTALLFANLEEALQGFHEEEAIVEQMATTDRQRRHWRNELRPPFFAADGRVTLSDVDGAKVFPEWEQVLAGPPQKMAGLMHRFLLRGSSGELLPWPDDSGSVNFGYLLDLHHRERAGPELAVLQQIQQQQFEQEKIPSRPTDAETLSLARRFPWAPGAHEALLSLGNRLLWAGRPEAARRCFEEVIDHGRPGRGRDRAQVGLWTAKVHAGTAVRSDQLREGMDPDRIFWRRGKRVSAESICRELLEGKVGAGPAIAVAEPELKNLTTRVLTLAEPSLWPGQLPGTVDLQWMPGDRLLVSGRTILSLFDRRDLSNPLWRTAQPLHGHAANFHPGYFRPTEVDGILYLRAGDEVMPTTISALDLNTGRAKWSADFPKLKKRGRNFVPLGDPVFADGFLYSLQWSNQGGRSLTLACFDPQRQRLVWEEVLVAAKGAEDRNDHLKRASPHRVIFGNRVTVHEGAIYCSSNCGAVVRSDLRDGKTEWIHNYRSTIHREPQVGKLGAAPLVVDDLLICLPRDSQSVFALELRTGRRVWENPFIEGVELVGKMGDLVIVRGGRLLAGLEAGTGAVRWIRPFSDRAAGRCQLVGSSLYLGQTNHLLRIDARSGATLESRRWGVDAEQVLAFNVRDQELIVVTDHLPDDRHLQRRAKLEWHGPYVPDLLFRRWTDGQHGLRRKSPGADSSLQGLGYGHSSGRLQCFDVRLGGGLLWQRRVDAWAPDFHFVGERLLVLDRVDGHLPGLPNRIRAYEGRTGRPLWNSQVPKGLNRVIPLKDVILFYRENHQLLAIDSRTGRKLWDRRFPPPQMMRLLLDDDQIHLILVSRVRTVSHLVLDSETGQTVNEHRLHVPLVDKEPRGAEEVAGGYLEVSTEPVTGRYVRLVALSEVNNKDHTTIGDLQVMGEDGVNLPRDRWRVHFVDSFSNSGYEDPENAIDEDVVSWWHTVWKHRGDKHPHEIQVDLGEEITVTGIRYLPATIRGSTGMIKDYELYVAKEAGDWGKPLAKGVMSARPHLTNLHSRDQGVAFEVRSQFTGVGSVLHYGLDGRGMQVVRADGRIIHQSEEYYVSNKLDDREGNHFVVHRFDDSAYRFDLGLRSKEKSGGLKVVGERLTMGPKEAIEVDLQTKRFLKK